MDLNGTTVDTTAVQNHIGPHYPTMPGPCECNRSPCGGYRTGFGRRYIWNGVPTYPQYVNTYC
jgi:hypothetical protein